MAANVFFMSWALLGVAPSSAGFGDDSHAVSNCRFAKRAHMGQSKVNVRKAWPEKTVFFRPDMTCITECGRSSGMLDAI
jgi:hypothetical protein